MSDVSILLVDDHAIVRAGYRRFLEGVPGLRVLAEAGSADEGYAAYCEHRPDVSVIDLSMPGVGGFDLIRRIVGRDGAARLLACSMHEDALFAAQALQAGASGYITKSSAPDTLVAAVLSASRGLRYLSPDIAASLRPPLGGSERERLDGLSTREFEIFRMIAQGWSRGEIAAAVSLSQKTIANYQTAIKEKLGVATTAALVHVALRQGVIGPPGPQQAGDAPGCR